MKPEDDRTSIERIKEMTPNIFRDHISQQCGFNKEKPLTALDKLNLEIEATNNIRFNKSYALQVCNAGAMPDHLPTSFEDWIKQGNDAIDLDRTEATCKWFDELPKQLPF